VKKGLCLLFMGILITLLSLPGTVSPAFAAPARVAVSTINITSATTVQMSWGRGWHRAPVHWRRPLAHRYYGAPQVNNQYFWGEGNSGNTTHSVGQNQANTGNEGLNHGVAQDNSINAGNQMINRHEPRGYRINNQYFYGRGNTHNTFIVRGHNQDNSGNEGVNRGVVQDNSTNAGNQMIN